MQGEIAILREWNHDLQEEKEELSAIVFRKFGLIPEQNNQAINPMANIPPTEVNRRNWNQIRSELEFATKVKREQVLTDQEKYWKDKLTKENDKTADKMSNKTAGAE